MEHKQQSNYYQICLEHLYKRRQQTPNQDLVGSCLINEFEITEDDDEYYEYQETIQNIADLEILQLLQSK